MIDPPAAERKTVDQSIGCFNQSSVNRKKSIVKVFEDIAYVDEEVLYKKRR